MSYNVEAQYIQLTNVVVCAKSIALSQDGKYVLVGFSNENTGNKPVIFKYDLPEPSIEAADSRCLTILDPVRQLPLPTPLNLDFSEDNILILLKLLFSRIELRV